MSNPIVTIEMDDGCSFIVRPSGTEPKIKVYILGVGDLLQRLAAQLRHERARCV